MKHHQTETREVLQIRGKVVNRCWSSSSQVKKNKPSAVAISKWIHLWPQQHYRVLRWEIRAGSCLYVTPSRGHGGVWSPQNMKCSQPFTLKTQSLLSHCQCLMLLSTSSFKTFTQNRCNWHIWVKKPHRSLILVKPPATLVARLCVAAIRLRATRLARIPAAEKANKQLLRACVACAAGVTVNTLAPRRSGRCHDVWQYLTCRGCFRASFVKTLMQTYCDPDLLERLNMEKPKIFTHFTSSTKSHNSRLLL